MVSLRPGLYIRIAKGKEGIGEERTKRKGEKEELKREDREREGKKKQAEKKERKREIRKNKERNFKRYVIWGRRGNKKRRKCGSIF